MQSTVFYINTVIISSRSKRNVIDDPDAAAAAYNDVRNDNTATTW